MFPDKIIQALISWIPQICAITKAIGIQQSKKIFKTVLHMLIRSIVHIKCRFHFLKSIRLKIGKRCFEVRECIDTRNCENSHSGQGIYYVRLHWSLCDYNHRCNLPCQMCPPLGTASILSVSAGYPTEFPFFRIVTTNLKPLNQPVLVTNGNQNATLLMDESPVTVICTIETGYACQIITIRKQLLSYG